MNHINAPVPPILHVSLRKTEGTTFYLLRAKVYSKVISMIHTKMKERKHNILQSVIFTGNL